MAIGFGGAVLEDGGDVEQEIGAIEQGFGALVEEAWCWDRVGKLWRETGPGGHLEKIISWRLRVGIRIDPLA